MLKCWGRSSLVSKFVQLSKIGGNKKRSPAGAPGGKPGLRFAARKLKPQRGF